MAWSGTRTRRSVLAGDGGLMTTAAFALVLGIDVVAGTGSHTSNVAAGLAMAAAVAAGPFVAWRFHGRHAGLTATTGALLGFVAGGGVTFLVLLGASLAARAAAGAGLFASVDEAMPTTGLVVAGAVGAVTLGGCCWLAARAAHDLARGRRHVWLDVLRLAAGLTCAAYVALVLTSALTASGEGAGMSDLLLLASPVLLGAAAVTVADLTAPRHRRAGGLGGVGAPTPPASGHAA